MKRNEHSKTYTRPAPVEGLPESPELERAVLGALILEPEYLPDTAEMIEISAFQTPIHGKIYGMMLSMLAEGVKIDLYTLTQRCKTVEGLGNPAAYLAKLTQAVGSGVNVLDHARQLKDTETRRRLCLFGHELAVRAASDPSGVLDWATTEITAIAAATVHANDITPLSDVVRATLDDLERRQQARQVGECIGIPTGLQRLDALTGGWRGGQLVVLAGRPGMGKSAAMLHFARTAAVAGVPVCVFSLEMPDTQLAGRMLVGGSGVNSGSFRTGDIDADGWRELERAAAELSALPVYFSDCANITMGTIRSQCKAMARRGRCGMVIIDYLQLLDTASRNTNSTREREIAAASRTDPMISSLIDCAQTGFARPLTHREMEKLVNLYVQEGFAPETVMLCVAYVASCGKRTMAAVVHELKVWRTEGVETGEQADAHLKLLALRRSREQYVSGLLGISTDELTLGGRKAIARWYEVYGYDDAMVQEAAVQAGPKRDLWYWNSILKTWNAKGLRTVHDVRGPVADAGASRNIRVDREAPSGNDFLGSSSLSASLNRLKKRSNT